MSNMDAAILSPQVSRLSLKLEKLKILYDRYTTLLKNISTITLISTRPGVIHAHHLFTVLIETMSRSEFIDAMHLKGIGVVVNYPPVHLMSYFRETYGYKPGAFPNAERIGEKVVSLPYYVGMTVDDVDIVVEAITDTIGID